jgi:hypothetical protein
MDRAALICLNAGLLSWSFGRSFCFVNYVFDLLEESLRDQCDLFVWPGTKGQSGFYPNCCILANRCISNDYLHALRAVARHHGHSLHSYRHAFSPTLEGWIMPLSLEVEAQYKAAPVREAFFEVAGAVGQTAISSILFLRR